MTILVTGAAGFIGMHVCRLLLAQGHQVVGIDNLNDYYPVALKQARLANLDGHPAFSFTLCDIADADALASVFATCKPRIVINLAAQAGVRYSLTNPEVYVASNLVGFSNILELCKRHQVEGLVYASSSSVYGANTKIPFSVSDRVDNPVSFYAATKKSNEILAHSYSHVFGLKTIGLRYFTVYGPWGRPDMAPWIFSASILAGKPIDVFNNGDMYRDFTFVNDAADATVSAMESLARLGPGGYRLYNIGNNSPVRLMDFIAEIERAVGRKAEIRFKPMQEGDVVRTYADITESVADLGYNPSTSISDGLGQWASWFGQSGFAAL